MSCTVRADVLLFDLETQYDEWLQALSNEIYALRDRFDFGLLADFGIEEMDGPLTRAGNSSGSIPAGFIPPNVSLDSNLDPFGGDDTNGRGAGGEGLLGIGPSAGFGNPANALLANFPDDSFDFFGDIFQFTAISFHAISLEGSSTVDLTVFDLDGVPVAQFYDLDAPPAGHEYGLIVVRDSSQYLSRVNFYDSEGGMEGILGETITYVGLPAPSCLSVLVAMSILGRRRMRGME